MLAELVALTLLVALMAYALTGGADFGGGVWDLLASGPRKAAQRALIGQALAPIWEANHVWLILVVVVTFVALPAAYAAMSVALHIPLALLLVGIVLRGAAFVFQSYDPTPGAGAGRWRFVFAIASVLSPLFLGVVLGALIGGGLRLDAELNPRIGFFAAWLEPFPFLVGLFVLTLFAWLAAVYLTVEAESDRALQRDFRKRAMIAGFAAALVSIALLVLAAERAPRVAALASPDPRSLVLQIVVAALGIGALLMLRRERYRLARLLAAAQVALIVLGLGLTLWPFVIVPDLTFEAALAPPSVVEPLLIVLAIGGPPLIAALVYLYRVFKPRAR